MSRKSKGSRKAPRKHNPHWNDNTRAERQRKRNADLNRIAGEHGYYNDRGQPSWSAYATAVIRRGHL